MTQNDDRFVLILEKLSNINERTARMEVEQKNIKEDLEEVRRQDVHQNQLLAEHIKGVETANARLNNEISIREILQFNQTELKSRVEKLEEPKKFLMHVKQIALYIAAIAGAVLAVMKFIPLK